jgi:hypothetical protein
MRRQITSGRGERAMTHGDSLALTVQATQRSLEERLGRALAPQYVRERPRERYATTDAFLAGTSRHLSAVEAVLLPSARRVMNDGGVGVRQYLRVARRLEQTLSSVKARTYGEAHVVHMSGPQLWATVQHDLSAHNRLEWALVEALIRYDDPGDLEGLARRMFDAESHGPTRPHPYLPHSGPWSRVARRLWAVADRFWDTAEGRVIPEPVHPVPHRHDSLLGQYLVADPHFDDQASMREHRRRPPKTDQSDTPPEA